MKVIAIAEDGRNNVTMNNGIAYALVTNGGKPGQCYPCVLIIYERNKK